MALSWMGTGSRRWGLSALLLSFGLACSEGGSSNGSKTSAAGGTAGTGGTSGNGGAQTTGSGGNTTGAGGTAQTTTAAGGSSAGGSSVGGASATSGGASGAGGQTAGPPEVSCDRTQELEAEKNYGTYSLYAVRLDPTLVPGVYSVRVRSGDDGIAYVFRGDTLLEEVEYDPALPLEQGSEQTVAFPGLFELDIRSQTEPDLSSLDESMFDGCHVITVVDAPTIAAGETYGPVLVEELTIDPEAPAGTYTFFAETGNAGVVQLLRDGEVVDTLDYAWQTTIGDGESFSFDFSGVVSFSVTRSMGTSNLFVLASEIFDGRHRLVVE